MKNVAQRPTKRKRHGRDATQTPARLGTGPAHSPSCPDVAAAQTTTATHGVHGVHPLQEQTATTNTGATAAHFTEYCIGDVAAIPLLVKTATQERESELRVEAMNARGKALTPDTDAYPIGNPGTQVWRLVERALAEEIRRRALPHTSQ